MERERERDMMGGGDERGDDDGWIGWGLDM